MSYECPICHEESTKYEHLWVLCKEMKDLKSPVFPETIFFIRDTQIILMSRLLTQNREHNLKNTPFLDGNGTCIQGPGGYRDSRMVKYIFIQEILI